MRTVRLLVAVLVALGVSTPAAAQFKKLKDAVTKKSDPKPEASAPQPPADGGTVALTPDVVDRLLIGFRAAKAEREKAAKEDTPYGRYVRAQATYDAAQPKCGAAQMTWTQRMVADEKLGKRYTTTVDKAMAAQQKGDMAGYQAGMYEALGIIDPSCTVKEPERPGDYNECSAPLPSARTRPTSRLRALRIRSGGWRPTGSSRSSTEATRRAGRRRRRRAP
jgi:hypothetical protein